MGVFRPDGGGLPRWLGDSNFMTTVAETRVLPEWLDETHAKIVKAWT